ncbi:MAG: hypothetical protein ACMXYE_03880 [Candidatus Woesearchaeota archaeon]
MVTNKDYNLPQVLIPRIYYVGVFDYNKLISTIATWFNEEGYEFHEQVFKHKVPSPDGSEQEFTFRGWRKYTEYLQIWISVKGHVYELKEIEALVDGEKQTLAKGRLELLFSFEIWLDFNNKFQSPMEIQLQNFLHNYVWKKKIEGGYEDMAYYAMYRLHHTMKKVLKMSTPSHAAEIRGY